MKLKYYMRGLGIGILVTTIVLTFGGKKERLSDKEIMARAGELGMVMVEENDDNLEKVLEKSFDKFSESNDVEPTDVSSDSEAPDSAIPDTSGDDTDSEVPDASEDGNDSGVSDTSEEVIDNEIPDTSEDDTDSEVPDSFGDGIDNEVLDTSGDGTDSEVPDSSDEDTNTGEEGTSEITFTIVRGMSSRQVSELVMQKGLVDDATDFDNFIKQNGKAGLIRIGTYTLPKDSVYQVILDAIVG